MRNKLLGALGLHGCKASITVKTMNGEVTKISEVLDGIEVAQASNAFSHILITHFQLGTLTLLKKRKRKYKLCKITA